MMFLVWIGLNLLTKEFFRRILKGDVAYLKGAVHLLILQSIPSIQKTAKELKQAQKNIPLPDESQKQLLPFLSFLEDYAAVYSILYIWVEEGFAGWESYLQVRTAAAGAKTSSSIPVTRNVSLKV